MYVTPSEKHLATNLECFRQHYFENICIDKAFKTVKSSPSAMRYIMTPGSLPDRRG
jgi:hypothetical protein